MIVPTETVDTFSGPMDSVIAGLKQKTAEFTAALGKFQSGNARVPKHKAKLLQLKDMVAALPAGLVDSGTSSRIKGLESAVAGLAISSKFSAAIAKAQGLLEQLKGATGLGAPPLLVLIPLASAALVGAIAILNGWNKHENNVAAEIANVSAKLALIDKGKAGGDILDTDKPRQGFIGELGDIAKVGIIVALAFVVLPMLKRGRP